MITRTIATCGALGSIPPIPPVPSHPSADALRRVGRALRDESGAATAEYAIATLAAVGFAGLLVVVLRGDDIKGMLTDLIHRALSISI